MDVTVIVAIIGAIEGIGVAVIGALIAKGNKRTDEYRKERERREDAARKINEASLNLQFAQADALDVLLRKAHGDNLNGEVQEARDSMHRAVGELNKVCNAETARLL